ncbi:hypothetical protein DYB37_004987 [Aphanomyces astaci]|uniref:RanBP2-type domain-containing protein n=1 Tax=Aphanomyces astaci TaxID=112090 RepID=A0A3R7B5F5_APHAT|nr:hypothetical protein DYB37_004987 [Aphanomyces astaci]
MRLITPMPSEMRPKIVCFPSNHGVGANRKKRKKKEKKHKKSKRHHANDDIDEEPHQQHETSDAGGAAVVVPAVKTDRKKDFFAQLKEQEATKVTVGTIHTSGRKQESGAAQLDNWECVKAGCGNSNMKRATSCLKCGAMRRITQWR